MAHVLLYSVSSTSDITDSVMPYALLSGSRRLAVCVCLNPVWDDGMAGRLGWGPPGSSHHAHTFSRDEADEFAVPSTSPAHSVVALPRWG
jgi:hypothetical protein